MNLLAKSLLCCLPSQRKPASSRDQQLINPIDISGCVFCDIRTGRDPDIRKVQYTDEHVFVLPDKYPNAESHLLVLPNRHIGTVTDLRADNIDLGTRLAVMHRSSSNQPS